MIENKRVSREKETVAAMILMYCQKHHKTSDFCDKCNILKNYAFRKIENCKFAENKPACSKCSVHCYKIDKREDIKKVMRYSGPRMIYKHPVFAFFHIIDKFKKYS